MLTRGRDVTSPRDLLEAAIEASGLSARRFARTVLLRDERTIRRWLAGDSPIPAAVVTWLKESATTGRGRLS